MQLLTPIEQIASIEAQHLSGLTPAESAMVSGGSAKLGPRKPFGERCIVEDVQHPIVAAISPLVDAVGARIVSPDEAEEGDLHLHYDGQAVAVVRLPDLHGALERQVSMVETEMGEPLNELSFDEKRVAVRLLEARGAFTIRKGAEQIADALGVSRFTIYNYLNASRNEAESPAAKETGS